MVKQRSGDNGTCAGKASLSKFRSRVQNIALAVLFSCLAIFTFALVASLGTLPARLLYYLLIADNSSPPAWLALLISFIGLAGAGAAVYGLYKIAPARVWKDMYRSTRQTLNSSN